MSEVPPAVQPASLRAAPSPEWANVAAFDALARQEATAWARSPLAKAWRTGLVVLDTGSLVSGPSGGFPSDADKEAFINGDLVFTGPPPSGAPPCGWPPSGLPRRSGTASSSTRPPVVR